MKLTRWIAWLVKPANGSRENTVSIIQSQESFRELIISERRRTDRNQHKLSLLLFTVGKQNANGVAVQNLAHVLAERIRSTDEVGWFDSKRIGIILPYTDADGAHKLADDICKAVTPESSISEYTVHTYPSNWFSDDGKYPIQFKIVDLPSKRKPTISQRHYLPARHAQERKCISATSSLSSKVIRDCKAQPQAIEPFFLQPLPIWKRIVDVLGASFGLVALSPILFLIALIIKVCYGSPVIFKQQRVGYSGRIFEMWKFRTMKCSSENSLHREYMARLINGATDEGPAKAMTKLDNELPVTAFGRVLRTVSLDELPQLVNVLRGEMSLIGPRPPTVYEAKDYSHWYCERFDTVPGMTGLWQVSGKNRTTFNQMIQLDIEYSRRKSLWLDLKIVFKTLPAIWTQCTDIAAGKKRNSNGQADPELQSKSVNISKAAHSHS